MRESVSAVFVTEELIYFIKRQNYLSVFPGYHATPGGKVDKEDSRELLQDSIYPKNLGPEIIRALIREVKEELDYDLELGIERGEVISIDYIGMAITPEFNPYRFKNYYLKISLKEKIDFNVDHNEVEYGEWSTPNELIKKYEAGLILAVPPAITLLKNITKNFSGDELIDMSLPHDPELEVPMIESLFGVRQFLPLSNTFPPANRTNAFIIGDEDRPKFLIDPSPKDNNELEKFLRSIDKIGFSAILLTHHHPDHYEFSNVIAKKYDVPIYLSEYTFKAIGSQYFEGIKTYYVSEGDVLTKSLNKDVTVFEVPGHDEGQIGIAPKSMEWFLVGDLVQTVGTVVIQAPEGNMNKYFQSLNKVINLNPKNIIPSHGIILGGTNKLSETLKHRMEREAHIKQLLSEHKNIEEMIGIIYPNLEERLIPYAKRTIEAHLLKINEELGL
jgi:ribonuclease/clavin/mitogillin